MADNATLSQANKGWQLETFVAVFISLEAVAVSLRFYARSLTVEKYNTGDALVAAAMIGQIVAAGMAIGSVKQGGVGQHASYLAETNPETITTFFKYLVAMSTWYASTEGLAKLAVCLLYKQLFPQRSIHLIVNITMALLIGASVGGGLADLFGCTPFSSHWGTAEEQAKNCIDTEALFVWGSFPNILTDVIMLVIPLPVVWKLHASIGMRIGLLITFLVGSIGLITSVLRFMAFYKKSSFTDPTFNAVELIIWTVCEPGVYLLASCLIVYRPLLDKLGIAMITGRTTRGRSNSIIHPMAVKLVPQSGENSSTKVIGLKTMSSRGFSQIDDGDESPLKKNTGIRTTTDVEISWEARSV